MFRGAIDVAEFLVTKITAFKHQRDNRRVRIANFFEKIGTCLEQIHKGLETKKPLDGKIKELETYLQSFPVAVGDIIGFDKTDELTAALRNVFDEKNFKQLSTLPELEAATHRKTLKEASNNFIDLWEALN